LLSESCPLIAGNAADQNRGPNTHRFGITYLSFYPFDAQAFLSSSYDHTLKIYSSETLQPSASFDLESIIYTHSLSPIASHLLVACASQHPAIRLVDLRSGSSTHTLAGHHGAVLSVAWSPSHEHILASGGADGAVRIWDVRKSAGNIGLLDLEVSIGVTGYDGRGLGARSSQSSKAHKGAVNGLNWTDDGQYIVTAGHDAAVRVWNAATGANTLANFGPTLKNSNLSTLPLLLSPTDQTPPAQSLLFYPNEHEILVFELLEGRLLKRLKVPGPTIAAVRARTGTGERNIKNRIMGLSWRGLGEGFVSGHSDGLVRFWGPGLDENLDECIVQDDGDAEQLDDRQGKRKRDVLEDVFRDLTRAKITFG
jgi:DNA excision repair protein ERCC-8